MTESRIYVAGTEAFEDPVVFEEYYGQIPEYRREKIDKIVPLQSKIASLGAGLLLKKMLSEIDLEDMKAVFGIGENGKPFLKEHQNIHFNLSHSGKRVMCILSDKQAGCDVERADRGDIKLAERFYSTEEMEYLEKIEDIVKRQKAFIDIWTGKESYIKALGKGMAEPLNGFSVFNLPDDYKWYSYDLRDAYSYSCCIKGEDKKPEIKEVSLI